MSRKCVRILSITQKLFQLHRRYGLRQRDVPMRPGTHFLRNHLACTIYKYKSTKIECKSFSKKFVFNINY